MQKNLICIFCGLIAVVFTLVLPHNINAQNKNTNGLTSKVTNLESLLPPGTIISSILPPDKFLKGFRKDVWALADGSSEKYNYQASKLKKLTEDDRLPDLRGMFLRGMNDTKSQTDASSDSTYPGLDPYENRKPGSYQSDSLRNHSHRQTTNMRELNGTPFSNEGKWKYTLNNNSLFKVVDGTETPHVSLDEYTLGECYTPHYVEDVNRRYYTKKIANPTRVSNAHETRPKNIAVYFYIKIN